MAPQLLPVCDRVAPAHRALRCIHENPVKAGLIENLWEYLYNSARDNADIKGLLEIELV